MADGGVAVAVEDNSIKERKEKEKERKVNTCQTTSAYLVIHSILGPLTKSGGLLVVARGEREGNISI